MWSDFQVASKQNKNQVLCIYKVLVFLLNKKKKEISECRVFVEFSVFFYGKTKSANERALVLSLEVDEKAADAVDDKHAHTHIHIPDHLLTGNMVRTHT